MKFDEIDPSKIQYLLPGRYIIFYLVYLVYLVYSNYNLRRPISSVQLQRQSVSPISSVQFRCICICIILPGRQQKWELKAPLVSHLIKEFWLLSKNKKTKSPLEWGRLQSPLKLTHGIAPPTAFTG